MPDISVSGVNWRVALGRKSVSSLQVEASRWR